MKKIFSQRHGGTEMIKGKAVGAPIGTQTSEDSELPTQM